jgi:hypothetical protein
MCTARYDRIRRLLVRFIVRTVRTLHILANKNSRLLRPVKNDLGIKVPDTHCIPYECGKVYVRQMDSTIEMRCVECAL